LCSDKWKYSGGRSKAWAAQQQQRRVCFKINRE
jgi:hypothetical protein